MSGGELALIMFIAVVGATVLGTVGRRLQQRRYHLRPFAAPDVARFQQRLDGLEPLFELSPNQALTSGKRLVDEMLTAIGLPERESDKQRLSDLKIVDSRCYRGYKDAIKTRRSASRADMHKTLEYYLAISRRLLEKASPRRATAEAETTSPG